MPLLKIQTNVDVPAADRQTLLANASRATATVLGKPEAYVMVTLEANHPMLFAGTDAPLAYLELKSIGLPEDRTRDFSAKLSDIVEAHLHIPKNRIYVEFASAAAHMWGWNGETF
ncbi:MAG: phenylpyruvate tautomerase MIF-related protein [Gammaproteobacteria bacterium]|nr:phenylpyruvate tautomerase MIF-related protein [Gammaproteobacteria bacterium]